MAVKRVKGIKNVINKAGISQIPENALLDEIVRELDGREMFTDADPTNKERLYSGDIFEQIASEQAQLNDGSLLKRSKKALQQLDELAELIDTEYVQITLG